jgi:uncharacterized membrane protein YadS
MSKKTYAIVAGIIGAVVTAAETIIPLFDLPKESLILGAVAACGSAAIAVVACFIDTSKIESKKEVKL